MSHSHREEIAQAETDFVLPPPQGRIIQIRQEVAHIISTIVHPMLFPLLTIGVVGYTQSHNALLTLTLVMIAIVFSVLPVSFVVWLQVKRGVWSDFDVSRREQRYTLYPLTLVALGLVAFLYYRLHAFYALRSVNSMVFANLINSLINLFWKISAHATAAAASATLLWLFAPAWGPPAAISAVMVSWSRVELGRHTKGQVIAGSLVGFTSAFLAYHL